MEVSIELEAYFDLTWPSYFYLATYFAWSVKMFVCLLVTDTRQNS